MILHWLLLSYLGQHIVQGDDTFVCPSASGIYPHPDTNTRFYRCVDSNPVLHICTTGIFVPSKGFCLETQNMASTTTVEPKSVDRETKSTSLNISSSASPSTPSTDATTTTKSTATITLSALEKEVTTAAIPTTNNATSESSSSTAGPAVVKTTQSSSSTTQKMNGSLAAMDEANQEGSTNKPATITSTTTTSTTTTMTTTPQADATSTEKSQREEKAGAETFRAFMDDDYLSDSDDSGSHEEPFFHCPSESGFFRHPSNCSRFYWCTDNRPTGMFCSPGTAFDPDTNVCSWIVGSDGCGGRLAAPTHNDKRFRDVSEGNVDAMNSDDVLAARYRSGLFGDARSGRHPRQAGDFDHSDNGGGNGRGGHGGGRQGGRSFGVDPRGIDFGASAVVFQCPGDGFYADPRDCSIFYHCSNGKPYRHHCQPGTAFNKDKLVCSWPVGKDGCGGMLSVPYKGVIDVQPPSDDRSSSNFKCPDEMEGYYPDPDDCTVFHHCVRGKQYRLKCGNGTAFNKENGVCSWPLRADTGCGAVLYKAGLDDRSPSHRAKDARGGGRRVGVKKREGEDKFVRRGSEESSHRAGHAHNQQTREESSDRMANKPLPRNEDEAVKGGNRKEGHDRDGKNSLRAGTTSETSTSSPSKVKLNEPNDAPNGGDKHSHEKESEHSPGHSQSSPENTKFATVSNQSKSTSGTKASTTTVSSSKTSRSPTESSAPKARSDDVEFLPGGVGSRQRTNAWPWEGTGKKQKARTATSTTTKTTIRSNSDNQGPSTTTQSPSVTQLLARKESPSTKETSTANPTTTHKVTTAKASPSVSTTPKPTTTAAATTTTTAATTTTTSSEASTVDGVKAEAYRVSGAETDFQCPSPSGHFRDSQNCAVYYHCADGVAFRKDCPSGRLYDINQHKCLPIPEVKDCRRVDEKELEWEEKWLSKYPEMDSYPDKVAVADSVVCEASYGYFKNERDCTSYVECLDGVPYPRRCMTGTVFDVSRKKCTWSSLVPDCRMAARNHPSDRNIQADQFQCPSPDGYYRDPFSCSNYYHCIDGTAMPRVCDPNFFFDPRASKCRWNRLVTDCDATGSPVVMDKLPLSSFVCPLPNGHYRDPKDCSVFYHCLRDVPYRGACQRHHAFDVDSLKCVPRAEVPGCDYNHVTEETEVLRQKLAQSKTVSKMDEATSPLSEKVSRNSEKEGQDRASNATSFRCPKAHGLFRDPHDCRIFYHCFSGRHFRHECQFGTVFSIDRNLCTWPSLVPDCQRVTESQEMTSPDPYTSNETKEWAAQSLPKDFSHDHQHDAPSPTSSEKSEASHDVTEERHDDVEENRRRDDVVEDVATDATSAAETGRFDNDVTNVHAPYDPSSYGVKTFVVEAPLPGVVDGQENYINFVCPQIVFDQYFRDPLDCTRFHRCVQGLRFTFDCPRGTFFDPVYNICDFQEKVPDCDHEGRRLGSAREPLGSSEQIPMPVYTGDGGEYMSEPSPDLTSSDMCPRSDGLFPHPSSCRKFVYCSHGTPVVLTCPADLLYNVDTMTCDYDENTVCVRYDK